MQKRIVLDGFTWFLLIRFVVGIFLVWAGSTFPSMDHHANINLVGLVIIAYNVGLSLWRYVPISNVNIAILQVTAAVLDFASAQLIVIEYSHTPHSVAVVFLPLLAYECWTFWGITGLVAGSVMTIFITLDYEWIKGAVWHHYASPSTALFWIVFLLIMAVGPVGAMLPRGVNPSQQHVPTQAYAKLTPREREVLDLVVQRKSLREIAEALHIEMNTAKTHAKNICQKFGVSRIDELPPFYEG